MFQRQKLFTQINARSYVEQYRRQGKFLRKKKTNAIDPSKEYDNN